VYVLRARERYEILRGKLMESGAVCGIRRKKKRERKNGRSEKSRLQCVSCGERWENFFPLLCRRSTPRRRWRSVMPGKWIRSSVLDRERTTIAIARSPIPRATKSCITLRVRRRRVSSCSPRPARLRTVDPPPSMEQKEKCGRLQPGTLLKCTKELGHQDFCSWWKTLPSCGPSVCEKEGCGFAATANKSDPSDGEESNPFRNLFSDDGV
jgi:hypothetical protein